jgi:hypothetical protein
MEEYRFQVLPTAVAAEGIYRVNGDDVLGGRERCGGVVAVARLVLVDVVADPAVRGAGGALDAERVGKGVGLGAAQVGSEIPGEVVGGEHLDESRKGGRGGVCLGDGGGDGQLVEVVFVEALPGGALDAAHVVLGELLRGALGASDGARDGLSGPGPVSGLTPVALPRDRDLALGAIAAVLERWTVLAVGVQAAGAGPFDAEHVGGGLAAGLIGGGEVGVECVRVKLAVVALPE